MEEETISEYMRSISENPEATLLQHQLWPLMSRTLLIAVSKFPGGVLTVTKDDLVEASSLRGILNAVDKKDTSKGFTLKIVSPTRFNEVKHGSIPF